MNIDTLNTIANKAFKTTEADAMIVLFNAENGVEVHPYWEHSCEFKSKQEMMTDMEQKTIKALIGFADNNGGESIGVFAMEYTQE